MSTIEGLYAQPATGRRSATLLGATRDENALTLPRSESGIKRIKPNNYDDLKLDEFLRLNDTNYEIWRINIIRLFRLCRVEGYVKGTLLCPDPNADLEGAENWAYNDNFTRTLISWNVTPSELVHILACGSVHEMWKNLEDVHVLYLRIH